MALPAPELRQRWAGFLLRPCCLIPGIVWRYSIYFLSRGVGRLRGFLSSGWRPAVIWLLLCVTLALIVTNVLGPGPVSLSANPSAEPPYGTEIGANLSAAATLAAGADATRTSAPLALAANITARVADGIASVTSQMSPESWAGAALLFLFGIVVYYGYRTRHQVVIGTFTSYVGDDTTGKFADGVGALLTGELHRLRTIYAEVDDRRAIASLGGSGTGAQLEYAIRAGDSGEEIANAIDAKTTMKVGPVEVPIGAVAGVLSRVMASPTIGGSLHRDGDRYILTAFMSGRRTFSWRVEGTVAKRSEPGVDTGVKVLPIAPEGLAINLEERDKRIVNLDVMVSELARRIFTDLTAGGSTRWRATYYFTEGLLDYRSCLLSRKDQLKNLRNAERRFLQAVSEDGTFDLAWYNLGVVYAEQRNLEAAEQAFLRAIQINPERWEAYYALSLNRFVRVASRMGGKGGYVEIDDPALTTVGEHELQDIIQPCAQAIALRSREPNLYILSGVCYRMLAVRARLLARKAERSAAPEGSGTGRAPDSDPCVEDCTRRSQKFFKKAFENHRTAVRLSWRALCKCHCQGVESDMRRESDARYVSSTALWDLARTYFAYHEWKKSIQPRSPPRYSYTPIAWLFQQALAIERANAIVCANLGVIYYATKRFRQASDAFRLATQIDPTNQKYWVLFAISADCAGRRSTRELALKKVLENPSWIELNLSTRWREELFHFLQADGRGWSQDLRDILDFQGCCCQGVDSKTGAVTVPGPDRHCAQPGGQAKLPRPYRDEIPCETVYWNKARSWYHAARADVAGKGSSYMEKYYREALAALDGPEEYRERTWSREVARTWARGLMWYELACCTRKSDDYQQSFDCFHDAHPREIKDRRIDIHLVEALLAQRRNKLPTFNRAFDIASLAQYRNPLGFEENFLWGRCHFAARDYRQALHFLESALLLEPFDIDTLRYIGYCYWKLGYYCQDRDEKTTFWKQAIHYFDAAATAISAEKLTPGADARDGEAPAREPGSRTVHAAATAAPAGQRGIHAGAEGPAPEGGHAGSWKPGDREQFEVALYLGDCHTGVSEYGKALSNYERAMILAQRVSGTCPLECYCALKCAEALLHKRDHCQCELYLLEIFMKFHQADVFEDESRESPEEYFERWRTLMLTPMKRYRDSIDAAYAGEIFVRALVSQAYSYAERDTRLAIAVRLTDRADRILTLMVRALEKEVQWTRGCGGRKPPWLVGHGDCDRMEEFLRKRAPVLRADIRDKRGWLVFKQYARPGNLERARKLLHDAVALQPQPEYYFHLAYVYAALARETEMAPIHLRMALAYCVHALDMAPRKTVEEQVVMLKATLEAHVKTLDGAFDGSLGKAFEKKQESGKAPKGQAWQGQAVTPLPWSIPTRNDRATPQDRPISAR